MTAYSYAIRYPSGLIHDPTWTCVADVLASYHGGYYCEPDGRVTGILVRAVRGSEDWETV